MDLLRKSLYRLGDFFSSSKYATIITIAIVIAAIPMTVLISQQKEQVGKLTSSKSVLGANNPTRAVLGAGSIIEHHAIDCIPKEKQISIYTHKNYNQNVNKSDFLGCVTLGIGDYQYPSETSLNLYYYDSINDVYRPATDSNKKSINDAISSIKLGANVRAVLYQDKLYGGSSFNTSSSNTNLANSSFDNKTSSIKVISTATTSTYPPPGPITQDRLCSGGYIVSKCTDCSDSFDCRQYNNAWSCCPKPSSPDTDQSNCNNACKSKGGECVWDNYAWKCPCDTGNCSPCLNIVSGGLCKKTNTFCSTNNWISGKCPGGSDYKCCSNTTSSGGGQPSGGGSTSPSTPSTPSSPSTPSTPTSGGTTGELRNCPRPDRCSDTYINCRPLWYSTDPTCSDTWNSTKTYSVDCMCKNDPIGQQATRDCRDAPGGKDTSYCSLISGNITPTPTPATGTSPGGGTSFNCSGQVGNIIYSCLTSCPVPSWQSLPTIPGACASGETCCYFDSANPGGGGGASPITPVPGGGGGSGGSTPLPTDSPSSNQPTPTCNQGSQVGPCVSDNNTCGSSNGIRYITYTTHNTGAQCSQFTTYDNVCGITNCDFGNKCDNNQCVPDTQPTTDPSTSSPTITPGSPTIDPTQPTPTAGGPTPTRSPNAATLNIVVGLDGLGVTGDSQNPASGGNKNPKTTIKKAKITAINLNTNSQTDASVDVFFEPSTGMFKTETNLEKGLYLVKIKVEGYLRKILSINLNVNDTKINTPTVNLTTGDINDDNILSVLDYNILISCSTYSKDDKKLCSSGSNFMLLSDLNSDGKVDEVDFNLFTREYSVQTGD